MSSVNLESIKGTIRKLMSVADHGSASENEVASAMALAAKLLDKHHLTEADVAVADPPLSYGKAYGVGNSPRLTGWEQILSVAVARLFGTVQTYRPGKETMPIRVDGIIQMRGDKILRGQAYAFYGPDEDAREAAQLFTDWSRAVMTMATIRWGGAYKGDGAVYAKGFCESLLRGIAKARTAQMESQAKPLIGTTAITLAGRFTQIKEASAKWLSDDQGIPLKTRSLGNGYRAGSDAAYEEGLDHGKKAKMDRATKMKRLT